MKYYVNVEGHELTTEFNYGGFCECLEFIHKYAKDENTRYKIEIKENNEVK